MKLDTFYKVKVTEEKPINFGIDLASEDFKDGLVKIKEYTPYNTQYGYLDKNGEVFIAPKYSSAFDFCEGFAAVQKNEKFGYISKDDSTKEIIPCIFDEAYDFSRSIIDGKLYATVVIADNICTINSEGVICSILHGELCFPYKDGFTVVSRNDKIILYDEHGNEKLSYQAEDANSFENGILVLETVDENFDIIYNFVSTKGKKLNSITEPESSCFELIGFSEGVYIILDQNNNEIYLCPIDFDKEYEQNYQKISLGKGLVSTGALSEDCFPLTLKDERTGEKKIRYYKIDKKGNKLAYFNRFYLNSSVVEVSDISPFYEGLAAVRVDKLYGFVDKSLNFVIPPQFKVVSNFSEGYALVTDEKKEVYFIDKTGKKITKPISYIREIRSLDEIDTLSIKELEIISYSYTYSDEDTLKSKNCSSYEEFEDSINDRISEYIDSQNAKTIKLVGVENANRE